MTGRLAVLACTVLLPAALHAQGVAAAREKAMRDNNWGPIQQNDGTYAYLSARSEADMERWRDLLDKAQWSTVSGIDCEQHQLDMEKFYNGAPMYWAVDVMPHSAGRDGQTIRATDGNVVEFLSVFNWEISRSDDEMLNLLLHEGWHWVHKETEEGTDAEDAERCAALSLEEEDDDEPGGGENPTEPVCEEKLVAVYYTVYEREYRAGTPCLASDDIDGATWCHGVGTWVLVAKQKVKWETQTVCSS